ncbi:MAG: amidohydrolase family protein, partial [Nocardioidaceae bacterium]
MTRILLRGGYVHTPADPHATALCIDGDAIVWTGDDDAAEHFSDNAEVTIDLAGRLVTPAFVDAHVHLAPTGLAALGVDLTGCDSATEALDRIAAYARGTDLPLVLGHGREDAALFTGEELARATGGRPGYVSRVDLHSAIVTGIAGYQGRVERDEHHAVRDAMAELITAGMREDAIRDALSSAAALGIGMVHEMGAPHIGPGSDFATLDRLADEGRYPQTVHYWGGTDLDEVVALGCAGAAGDLCVDGAIGSRTAALHAPYTDAPGTSGFLYLDAEQVADHLLACTERGIQAGFHAIGDRAASTVVAGFAAAADRVGSPALMMGRHRIEHLELATPQPLQLLG